MDTLLRNRRISASIIAGFFVILILMGFTLGFKQMHEQMVSEPAMEEVVVHSDSQPALTSRIDSLKELAITLGDDTLDLVKQYEYFSSELKEMEEEIEKMEEKIEKLNLLKTISR